MLYVVKILPGYILNPNSGCSNTLHVPRNLDLNFKIPSAPKALILGLTNSFKVGHVEVICFDHDS